MLQGNLSELPLLSLLQTLLTSSRSGAIHIRSGDVMGTVFLQRGLVTHAQVGMLEGGPALEFFSGLKQAKFKFEADVPVPNPTLPGGLETFQQLADMTDQWGGLQHIPHDWNEVLNFNQDAQYVRLDTDDLKMLRSLQGKSVANGLVTSESPLSTAQSLNRLIGTKALLHKPQLNITPIWLSTLTLYGPGQGVAYVEEGLYAQWRRAARNPIGLKLRHKGHEFSLSLEPRPNISGRVALFEKDLKRLKLTRGVAVEAWPYIP